MPGRLACTMPCPARPGGGCFLRPATVLGRGDTRHAPPHPFSRRSAISKNLERTNLRSRTDVPFNLLFGGGMINVSNTWGPNNGLSGSHGHNRRENHVRFPLSRSAFSSTVSVPHSFYSGLLGRPWRPSVARSAWSECKTGRTATTLITRAAAVVVRASRPQDALLNRRLSSSYRNPSISSGLLGRPWRPSVARTAWSFGWVLEGR